MSPESLAYMNTSVVNREALASIGMVWFRQAGSDEVPRCDDLGTFSDSTRECKANESKQTPYSVRGTAQVHEHKRLHTDHPISFDISERASYKISWLLVLCQDMII